jgi:hypothetical protein
VREQAEMVEGRLGEEKTQEEEEEEEEEGEEEEEDGGKAAQAQEDGKKRRKRNSAGAQEEDKQEVHPVWLVLTAVRSSWTSWLRPCVRPQLAGRAMGRQRQAELGALLTHTRPTDGLAAVILLWNEVPRPRRRALLQALLRLPVTCLQPLAYLGEGPAAAVASPT